MVRWFRPGPSASATALAMIGPRPKDEVLFLGARDPSFAAETGAVTRLNGRTVVVGEDAAAAATTERAAGLAGALLEFVPAPFDRLPFDSASFDLVVAPELADWPAERRGPRLAEAVRVLRPGGRMVLMVGEARRGFLGRVLARRRRPVPASERVVELLTWSGVLAARRLAEENGVTYYEGRKAR